MVVILNREPDVFAAISHPARRRILDRLIETTLSVNEKAAIASFLRSFGPYGTGWRTMRG